MAYIIAVDPGGTTGWAEWKHGEFRSGEEADWLHWIDNRDFDQDIFVIETYTITASTAKKSQQTDALRLTGCLEWMAYPYRKVIYQKPSEAKAFSTDKKLKRIGWYTPGKGHANDAARHLLLTCVRRGLVDPAIFLKEDDA